MHRMAVRSVLAFAVAVSLSACAQFERNQPVAAVDDDALCRGQGYAQGSKEYVACMKDRDVAASRDNRMERAHRNLAEDMLNKR